MEYTFRDCLMVDYDLLFRLKDVNLKKYIEECWGCDLEDQHRRQKEDLEKNIANKKNIVVDGNSAGVYATGYIDNDFFIEEINILKEYQNYKIGSRTLLKQMEDNAEIVIITKLIVLKNNPAKNLYERLGFKIYKEIEIHYYMKK